MRGKKKTTLTQEEMDYIFGENGAPLNSKSVKLLEVYYGFVDQSEHVFAFDMHYANVDFSMFGTDLVREFGPGILDQMGQ